MSGEVSLSEGLVSAESLTEPPIEANLAGEATETEPVEPVLIEVWRPHRQQHHARRPEARGGRKPQRSHATEASSEGAAPQAGAPAPGFARDKRRGERSHDGNRAAGETPADAAAGVADEKRQNGHTNGRQPSRGQSRERFEGPRNRRDDGAPVRSVGDDRRRGRGGQFGGGEKRSNERAPDPDSPFAKLAVLKARMEEKAKPEG